MNTRDEQTWRLIDTGLRRAAENMALNRAMLEAHQEGLIPHTLRFLQFTPSALVGFHQSVAQELRADYCRENGIDIQRRITGGGAIFFDPTQIGWELYLDKRALGTADMAAIARRICEAAADGISRLGVDAQFRPRNDIEVDGRKISGTGGAFDGDSILYQGTLLVDFDVERMLRVLRIPAEKLSDKAISSARERVVNLKELLGEAPALADVKRHIADAFGEAFGVRFEAAEELTAAEQEKYREALAEIDTDEWVYQIDRPLSETPTLDGIYRSEGGLMRVSVAVDNARKRIKQLWITGDFFVNPKRLVPDLEGALRDTPIEALEQNVQQFFDDYQGEMLMLKPQDFVAAIQSALNPPEAK
ncbi:lipoate--protein ligase family protein [Ectothiorhodospiraceae bacterium 2226]|nr:lipoate--protein ligase family protein [Ectothiorhodospiraceae bacterium 2226]